MLWGHMTHRDDISPRSCLYVGRVTHARLQPVSHRFSYRVFSLLLDIDEIGGIARRLRLFSYNRWSLFSFHDRDHGPRDGTPLRLWIERQLRRADIDIEGGPVRLLCFPRILGYVFNPLSVWFCHRPDGELAAILYEVHNTFGESHSYLISVRDTESRGGSIAQGCNKAFHVSPFIGMAARYRFRLRLPGERLQLLIRQDIPDGQNLIASHTGQRRPLTDRALMRVFATHPLMTVKVMAAIHWEALRLWLKGAPYHRRPAPPETPTTVVLGPAPAE